MILLLPKYDKLSFLIFTYARCDKQVLGLYFINKSIEKY